jgi:hypothetical protein
MGCNAGRRHDSCTCTPPPTARFAHATGGSRRTMISPMQTQPNDKRCHHPFPSCHQCRPVRDSRRHVRIRSDSLNDDAAKVSTFTGNVNVTLHADKLAREDAQGFQYGTATVDGPSWSTSARTTRRPSRSSKPRTSGRRQQQGRKHRNNRPSDIYRQKSDTSDPTGFLRPSLLPEQ